MSRAPASDTTPTLYGIGSCETVRKARRWLDEKGIAYRYHDLRRDGIDPGMLREWSQALGWETLVNRRSTTWRQLPARTRTGLGPQNAPALLAAHPTLIKRPVLVLGRHLEVGFSPERYRAVLKP